MLQITEQTFEEMVEMYDKLRDRDIISMLETRDKTKSKEDFVTLLHELYDKMSRKELVHFIARRDDVKEFDISTNKKLMTHAEYDTYTPTVY